MSGFAFGVDLFASCGFERETNEFAPARNMRPVVELVAHDRILRMLPGS